MMMEGFAERLKNEVTGVTPENQTINISTPVERKYSAWVGGGLLASISAFSQKMMVTT